jgi:hypothetical protein
VTNAPIRKVMLSVFCKNHADLLLFLLFTLSLRTTNMSRNVASSAYMPIVRGKPMNVDVRDPFTGLPVRTDAQEGALVDEAIDEQPLHPHAEHLEQRYDEDDNLMDLGVPLPFPIDILPDHDVDDWLLEVCR